MSENKRPGIHLEPTTSLKDYLAKILKENPIVLQSDESNCKSDTGLKTFAETTTVNHSVSTIY